VILKLFVAMAVITVYPQCNSNTLNVIATDMLQLFKMFIVIVIQNIFKIIAIVVHVKILILVEYVTYVANEV
jgi:hypothetical protein